MSTTNTLSSPLFSVLPPEGGTERLSLPGLLARLGRGENLEPVALRAHQEHALHAFLVQLGALVAHRSGDRSLDRTPEEWRDGLLALAGEAGEAAWTLVVPDLARPALFQPPVPEGSLAGFRNLVVTPDDLDVVITAKNHDVKSHRIVEPSPEHWIYSLLTLQTMGGYLGAGNYGIARMNGGFSSRPAVAAAPGPGRAERFRRDVGVWLDVREELIEDHGYAPEGGDALLWLRPWDGSASRSLQECDPFFIEICRRLRLHERDGRIVAATAPTGAAYLNARELKGDTGDIWTPVRAGAEGTAALTVGPSGFDYRLMTDLLFPRDYRGDPALSFRAEDGSAPVVIVQVLVRGQGKTEGYREREVPIPAPIRRRLSASPAEVESLGRIARERIQQAGAALRMVLKPALCALLQGGPERLNLQDERVRPWLERFDAEVDRSFFEALWDAADRAREEQERAWNDRLRSLASDQLRNATATAPVPLAQQPRAIARAELLFRGAARKHLPVGGRAEPASQEETP
jgi:CRISPR system Cascade subunit CasA